MKKILEDRVLNIVIFAITIVVNGMANGIPLNGQTTGQVSAKYPSLFTPAGFAFSIWGLIYISLAAFIIFQMLPAQRDNSLIKKINPYFKINCLSNAAWIFAWHYNALIFSLVLMICILFSLVVIYRLIYLSGNRGDLKEFVFIHFPFNLYTGWISVAMIANISVIQTGMGWDNILIEAVTWTLIKIAVAGAVGVFVLLHRADFVFGVVIAWAAYGISVKQTAEPLVSGAALILTIMIGVLILIELARKSFFDTGKD